MAATTEIHIIVAMTENRVIGKNGKLPWSLPEDLQLFKDLTLGGTVIMGRATFESIGAPLSGRENIVVSSHAIPASGVTTCLSFPAALDRARKLGRTIFCIGGERIFQAALPLATHLHVSWVAGNYDGDTFFPTFDLGDWRAVSRTDHYGFNHISYIRKK